ncbi:MAG: ABC transporter ATP-binding protein [Leucobacter sp.]
MRDGRELVSLIDVRSVAKYVELPDGSRLDILNDVSLSVEAGTHIAIVGRSGSGKTTLLNILGLLDVPSSGTVWFAGSDVGKLRKAALDRARGNGIGYVFQQFNLLTGLTAVENVMMPLAYATGPAFWRRRQLAIEMLDRVGLSHRLDSHPDNLSGGEQQRVAIARALIRKPRMILADEPTGALDVETGATVMKLLEEVATENGAALITITHDPTVAALASRSFRLNSGLLTPMSVEEYTDA